MAGLRLRRAAAGDSGLQVHRGEVGRPQNRRDRAERRRRAGQQPRGAVGEVHVCGEGQRDTARSANSTALPPAQSRLVRRGPEGLSFIWRGIWCHRSAASAAAQLERGPYVAALGAAGQKEPVMGLGKKAKREAKAVKGKTKKDAGKAKHKGKKAKNAAKR
jgi:hypothetical protein